MRIRIFFAQVLFIALFSSQINAQTTDLVKYLPENATMIMDIDGASLSQKLSWKELMTVGMFDSLLKRAERDTKKMITDPSGTGINFRDHIYLVVDFNEEDQVNPGTHIVLYGKVQDEAKLSALFSKAATKEIIQKTSGQNKMLIGKDFLFGWNNSVFALHSGTSLIRGPEVNVKHSYTKKELARLEKMCIDLLTPKPQNIFTTNKHFENLVNQKADMRIWIETAKMNSLGKGKNPFAMLGLSNDYQGKYKTAIVNFENGKVVSKGFTYYNNDLSASIQKMYAEKLNTELLKKIPSGNLLGLFAMSFKPEAIKEFIEKTGIWEEFKKMDEGKDGFDPGVFLDNLNGDVLMAVNLPNEPEEEVEGEEKNPFSGMQIYFAASVKNEKKVNQLIDSLKIVFEEKKKAQDQAAAERDSMMLEQDSLRMFQDSLVIDEEVYTPKKNELFKNMKPAYRVENGVFVLSLSEKHLAKFGAASNTAHDKLISEYGNNPMLMTIDLKTILSIVMTSMKNKVVPGEEDDPEMYSFFEVFDKWVITGGKFENGAMQTTQEIIFSNTDENSLNSLKQIMKMFDLIFSAIMKTKVKDVEIKQNYFALKPDSLR